MYLPHDDSRNDDDDRSESVGHDVQEDTAHVHIAGAVGVPVVVRLVRGRALLTRIHNLGAKIRTILNKTTSHFFLKLSIIKNVPNRTFIL
jgi:hypothetical protein